jgi:hypothetical protein
MKKLPLIQLIVALLLISLISACSDDTRVTLHEPHVYKGNVDTHTYNLLSQEKRLQQRTLLAFTDR